MGVSENPRPLEIQPQTLEKPVEFEETEGPPQQDTDFMVEAFDKAAGQASLEEIEDERPEALERFQKGKKRFQGLLFDQKHPGFQFILGVFGGSGGLENDEKIFAKVIQQP